MKKNHKGWKSFIGIYENMCIVWYRNMSSFVAFYLSQWYFDFLPEPYDHIARKTMDHFKMKNILWISSNISSSTISLILHFFYFINISTNIKTWPNQCFFVLIVLSYNSFEYQTLEIPMIFFIETGSFVFLISWSFQSDDRIFRP